MFPLVWHKQIEKGPAQDLILGVVVECRHTLIAIHDNQRCHVQDEYWIGYIVEYCIVFLHRILELPLETLTITNIEAHFHRGDNLPVRVYDRGGFDHPVKSLGAILAAPRLLAVMRQSVRECLLNRANRALFSSALVGLIAIVARARVEQVGKLAIITQESVVPILNGYNPWCTF